QGADAVPEHGLIIRRDYLQGHGFLRLRLLLLYTRSERRLSRLLAQPLERGARVGDERLELRVGVLPEVHEAAIVVAGLGVVTPRCVQRAETLQRRRERASVDGIKQHERSPDAPRGYAPLVHGQ